MTSHSHHTDRANSTGGGYPDISVKDTLVMDVLVTDILVTGHFGHRTFR